MSLGYGTGTQLAAGGQDRLLSCGSLNLGGDRQECGPQKYIHCDGVEKTSQKNEVSPGIGSISTVAEEREHCSKSSQCKEPGAHSTGTGLIRSAF